MPAQQRGRFDTVRKLPSGRYQVRYYGPGSGTRHPGHSSARRMPQSTLRWWRPRSPGTTGPILIVVGYFSVIMRINGSASGLASPFDRPVVPALTQQIREAGARRVSVESSDDGWPAGVAG